MNFHRFYLTFYAFTFSVFQHCEGGEIEEQMFNRIPNVQISTEATFLKNRSPVVRFFNLNYQFIFHNKFLN